jgi:chitinase
MARAVLLATAIVFSCSCAVSACSNGSIDDNTNSPGPETGGDDDASTWSDAHTDSGAPVDAKTDAKSDGKVDAPPGVDSGHAGDSTATGDTATSSDTATSGDTTTLGDTTTTPDTPTTSTGYLVGYYATWTRSTMPPSTVPWSKLTHVAHAFILPAATGGLQDVAGYVDSELISTAHANSVKVVASVGGAGANFDGNTVTGNRAKTVAALADLCKTYGYDGIDIDWEFPDATTAPSWKALITELRTALDAVRPGLTISAAVASGSYYGDNLPSDGLLALDWIGVMTYDYAGSWSSTSGHCSPLYPSVGGDGGSVSESMDYFLVTRAMPKEKVLLGLPFYGAEFGATAIDSTPVAPASAPDYRDVVPMMGTAGWVTAWDDTAKVPYLHRSSSPGFLSYDDATSIGDKCAYGKSRGVKGAIIWHLAGDRLSDGTNPLLTAAQPCR